MMLTCLLEISGQRCHALFVGVSKYEEESINLKCPKNDAERLYDVFGKDSRAVRSIITNRNAVKKTVLSELQRITQVAKSEDCIVFFFAGHGESDHLLMTDMNKLYYRELLSVLKQTKAQHVHCLIDACYSGSVKKEFYKYERLLKGSGINFVMACRENQRATESSWIGHGFFSQALITGLRGEADKNRNGLITLKELWNYIKANVTERTKTDNVSQTPQLITPSRKSLDSVIIHIDKEQTR
jgi:uncharacterized caspase-like protein